MYNFKSLPNYRIISKDLQTMEKGTDMKCEKLEVN